MQGLFITFEGTEGCGKTTQVQMLAQKLQKEGLPVVVLREPGGTPIGEEIRHTLKHSLNNAAMTPEAELLLLNASRAQLVREVIRPALKSGKIVLCDRFYDSTTAYQGYGRGLNLDDVRKIIEFAVGETRPDLTLFLDIPLELSLKRRTIRKNENNGKQTSGINEKNLRDRFEEADVEFFKRVQRGFHKIAEKEPQRIKTVDATRPVEEVFKNIC
ncbi:MAG TPA: dTMP kinase, partial [Verrucomicrobiota bacterium]|nr:dTMP kinase [Verrucomicrobiota bacterium]